LRILLTLGGFGESIEGKGIHVNEAQKVKISDVERLVESSSQGNRDAFDELVGLYQRRAMQVALAVLSNADEAAEAVQAGFVKAYLGIEKLKEPKKFEIWLLRIISNTAISQRKAAGRRAEAAKAADCPRQENRTFSPAQTADTKELRAAIQRAMLRLSKKEAKAITLFGLEDLSQKQVAEIMGCSVQAVRWHVFRARQKLKVLLRKYLE
jgi:RNA polymerase sigma-70 factor (ECF subfamily)